MTLSFLDKPTRHFVTGGAGFIGSHLVDRLLAMGHQVTVYDNLVARGKGGWSEPPPKEGLRLVRADLLDMEALQQSMKGHEFVWHLAANTDIPSGIKNIRMDLENCTIATHNVLEAMRHNGVKRIAFTSTSAVYGETDRMPLTEETGPVLPISLYGAGKLACEGFVSAFCHLFDMQAWIFRFGNVIGAQMGHGVIYDFIQKLRRSPHELEVLGDGKQEKNYFLVEDCIDGMLCAVRNSHKQCDVFILGSESRAKVTEIARIVIEEMALPDVRLRFTGGKRGWPGDVPQVHFDLGKMKRLGWAPRHTSLEAVRVATRRLLGKEG